MKIAIIGAGRNKSGIGQYIGKYFQKNRASVISVLGTTEKTACRASSILTQYGIDATYYTDFNSMMRRGRPDAVVIASPALTHYEYLIKCVKEGVHIFCEKPFVWQDKNDINSLLKYIFEMARLSKSRNFFYQTVSYGFRKRDDFRICSTRLEHSVYCI